MLSEFLRLNGGEYMKRVLRPAIKHFLKKDSVHYEVRLARPTARATPLSLFKD